MDQDILDRIRSARSAVSEKTRQRMTAEGHLSAIEDEIRSYASRLREEGVDPKTLDQQIEEAEREVRERLITLERQLNGPAPA